MVTQDPVTWAITGPDPTDPQHPIVTARVNDVRFSALWTVMAAQQNAASENTVAHDRYVQALNTYQQSVNAGRGSGLTAPAKPSMKVVDDLGAVTEVPFVPPLPDPVAQPTPTPSAPIGGDPTTRPPDPNQVLAMIVQMMFSMKTDIAAIKAKVSA